MLLHTHSGRRLDVRDASQPHPALSQLDRLPRGPVIVRAVLAILAPDRDAADVHGVGPVGGALRVLEGALLADQLLVGRVGDGHVARVDAEARRVARGRQVVVRRPRVPEEQVAGLGVDLDPLAALVGEPLHALVGEAVPLLGPGPDLVGLVLELGVELLGQQVRAL